MTSNLELARWYAGLLGVVLVVLGLAGFVDNPIVGAPGRQPVFASGAVQNMLHGASGAVALYIAFGHAGRSLVRAVTAFGAGYGLLFGLSVADGRLFGLFGVEVNLAGHVLHAGVGVLSVTVGWLAWGEERREFSSR